MRRANFIVKKKFRHTKTMLGVVLCSSLSFYAFNLNIRSPAALTTKVSPIPVAPVAKVIPLKRDELSELEKKFQGRQIIGMESLERDRNSKSLRITLNSDAFFQVGTANLEEASKNSIQQIVSILGPVSSMSFIEIEGHTDDSPVIHQKVNYPSNWELSAARAASFIPYFSEGGFFKDQLKVIGYGDSRPMFSNHTSNKISAKNRRIVLRIFTEDGRRI